MLDPREAPLEAVRALHQEVDAALGVRAGRLPVLTCKLGCNSCCQDGLTVFEVEAARILAEAGPLLCEGAPHAPGACAFLDEAGGCRVYAARPYVCRTQGLPLSWWEEAPEGWQERRDICALNEPLVELLALDEAACWSLGPFEGRLFELQRALDGGQGRRLSLRTLFEREPG